MKYDIRNYKELTEAEYISYLEGMAQALFMLESLKEEGTLCGHSKMNDPLYIKKVGDGYEAYSYVFSFHDGGRHHKFNKLQDIEEGLIKELKRIIDNNGQ